MKNGKKNRKNVSRKDRSLSRVNVIVIICLVFTAINTILMTRVAMAARDDTVAEMPKIVSADTVNKQSRPQFFAPPQSFDEEPEIEQVVEESILVEEEVIPEVVAEVSVSAVEAPVTSVQKSTPPVVEEQPIPDTKPLGVGYKGYVDASEVESVMTNSCTVDENGCLRYGSNKYYLVRMRATEGTVYTVTLEDGSSFGIVCGCKGATVSGSFEFIVHTELLPADVTAAGNMAFIDHLNGLVIAIQEENFTE